MKDISKKFNQLSPNDKEHTLASSFQTVCEDLMKLSDMVRDGKLSDGNAKQVVKELRQTSGPWKLYYSALSRSTK